MGHDPLDDPGSTATLPPVEPGPKPTSVRYRVLGVACLLAIVTYLHRAGFQTVSTELLRDLRMDAGHLGGLTAAFMIAYGLFEVPWGRLGDRLGARGLLTIIALGGSLLTAAVALVAYVPRVFAVQFGLLLTLRFLFGAFQAGTFPLLSRVIADWLPTTERGSAQGALWMSSRAGGVLAPIVMVALLGALKDWRYPLVVAAGLGVVWAAGFWPWFRDRPEEMPSVNEAERKRIIAGRGGRGPAGHAAPWGRMARSANVWALCGMYGFLGYSGNFFLFLLANYLEVQRGIDKQTAKWLTVAPFACGVVGCLAGGALSDLLIRRTGDRRWGRRVVGIVGLAVGAVGMLIIPRVNDPVLLGLVFGLTFIGNDLSMGPAWAAASDIGERHAGSLAGAMNMAASFMAALAAIVTGRLFRGHDLLWPFLLFSASYVLGILCWLRVDVTETLGDEPTPA